MRRVLEAWGCECVAYTTHSSTPAWLRWRVILPWNKPVPTADYKRVAPGYGTKFEQDIGVPLDQCYKAASQVYWEPRVRDEDSRKEHITLFLNCDQGRLDPDSSPVVAEPPVRRARVVGRTASALDSAGRDISKLLKHIDPSEWGARGEMYGNIIAVGMAIYHETEGEQFELWEDWLAQYPHPKAMPHKELYRQWDGFGNKNDGDLRRIGTLRRFAKQQGWVPSEYAFESAEQAVTALNERWCLAPLQTKDVIVKKALDGRLIPQYP